jgi:hypothetical protein
MSALGERVVDFLVEHTHSRYVGNRDEAYTSSYRVIRLVVGFLGVSLPIVFFFVEGSSCGEVSMSEGRSARTITRRCKTSSWAVCASSACSSQRTWRASGRAWISGRA